MMGSVSAAPLPVGVGCQGHTRVGRLTSVADPRRLVPGCPPTPEELMYGIFELQRKILSGELSRDSRSAKLAAERPD